MSVQMQKYFGTNQGSDVTSHDKCPYNAHLNLSICPEERKMCTTFIVVSLVRVVFGETRATAWNNRLFSCRFGTKGDEKILCLIRYYIWLQKKLTTNTPSPDVRYMNTLSSIRARLHWVSVSIQRLRCMTLATLLSLNTILSHSKIGCNPNQRN